MLVARPSRDEGEGAVEQGRMARGLEGVRRLCGHYQGIHRRTKSVGRRNHLLHVFLIFAKATLREAQQLAKKGQRNNSPTPLPLLPRAAAPISTVPSLPELRVRNHNATAALSLMEGVSWRRIWPVGWSSSLEGFGRWVVA